MDKQVSCTIVQRLSWAQGTMQHAVGMSVLNELQGFVCLSTFGDMRIVCQVFVCILCVFWARKPSGNATALCLHVGV